MNPIRTRWLPVLLVLGALALSGCVMVQGDPTPCECQLEEDGDA